MSSRKLSFALVTLAAVPTAHAQSADPVAAVEAPATEPVPAAEPAAIAEPPPTVEPPPAIDPALLAAAVAEELDRRDGIVWKDGFSLRSGDGAFELKIGGYTHFDGRYFAADDADKLPDQFTFRRIRPELKGVLLDRAEFRLLPDFAGGRVAVQDAYVDVSVAGGNALRVRAGKFKEPFGLERLQSATALLFVERALPTQLAPNRDLGLQLGGEAVDAKVAWQVGVFNGVADGGSGDGDVADSKEVAARVFVTPIDQLGVGGAVTYGSKDGTLASPDLPQLKTSGQATFFQYRTGETEDLTALADGAHWRATAQGHYYRGAAGVLAEYVRSTQEVLLAGAVTEVRSHAWHVALNYVLGGKAGFKSVSGYKALDPAKGQWGAVEFAARYHELRVFDAAFDTVVDPAKSAKQARTIGVGASWHLSKALRAVLDYEGTTFVGGAADDGDRPAEHAVLGRVQTVF